MNQQHDDEVGRGAAVYSKPVLGIYDLLVVWLSNTFVWRCHREQIGNLYDRNIGIHHLDVGPGTGWYLAHTDQPAGGSVTLLDINTNSLAGASARLTKNAPQTVVANVLEPLPDTIGPFDSIGANYVFHCLPGTWPVKGAAFGNLAERLAPEGVLFGSTILGRRVEHSLVGRQLMRIYNRRGIFHNTQDDRAGLETALQQHFFEVVVDVVGTVALFRAARPR